MRIPGVTRKLLDFARDTIELCTYSQAQRAQECAIAQSYYENGTGSEKQSLYNRTGVHIDRTSSYLSQPG